MKILIPTDAFPPGAGGSGQSASELARALARRGHDVHVMVGRQKKMGQTCWEGIPVTEVALVGTRDNQEQIFADALRFQLNSDAAEIIHAQHWLSARATMKAAPEGAVVVTVRDYWPVCVWTTMLSGSEVCPGCSYKRRILCAGRQRPWSWPVAPLLPLLMGLEISLRQRALEQASAIVAVSRHVADTLPFAGVDVIPNIVDVDRLDQIAKEPCRVNLPESFVLFMGKLEQNKAPDRLLQILDRSGTELPLVIAGSGSLEPSLRSQAARSGRDVRFLGWVDERTSFQLLRRAQAVVFPSRWQEPLSRVLLEALAVGAALVVEATGGTKDIVVHEVSGLVSASELSLAEELKRILDDRALSERLRQGAQERARAVFSESAVIPRLEALYQGQL